MFTSHLFTPEINDVRFNIRVLGMTDSYFIYIGQSECEIFDSLALAMKVPSNNEVVKTTIIECGDSTAEDIAFKLTKKLGKPVYLSCSGIEDRLVIQPAVINYIFNEVVPKLA
uniref:CSON002552 protein n=1 Tax=Culicoides sonorensis TaxID=179676 RepID=A0A336MKS2_CULSO